MDLLRDAGSIPAASTFQGMVTPVAIPCLIVPRSAGSLLFARGSGVSRRLTFVTIDVRSRRVITC